MHWISMEVAEGTQINGFHGEDEIVTLRPKLGFSTVEYRVVEDDCGGREGRGKCVEVYYAVDRQGKVVLLSIPDMVQDEDYIGRTLELLCIHENLSRENCRHLTLRVLDSWEQQIFGVQGYLDVTINGIERMKLEYPFPPEVSISSLPLGESIITFTLEFPGYSPGKPVDEMASVSTKINVISNDCKPREIPGLREGGIYESGSMTVSLGTGCLLVNGKATGHCDVDEVEFQLTVGRTKLGERDTWKLSRETATYLTLRFAHRSNRARQGVHRKGGFNRRSGHVSA